MKRTILILLSLITFTFSHAQKIAITEEGKEVILYDDGTWKYQDGEKIPSKEIPTNPNKFVKDDSSTFLLKSKNLNVGFYFNPKVWEINTKTKFNPYAEYELKLREEDLYCIIVTEKVEVPLESLKLIAIENGKNISPDLTIIKEEYRNVNGLKVLLLQMNGTVKGIKVSYYGYYYSSPEGTVQFITYTAQNLLEKYMPEIEKLLNGFVKVG